MLTSPKTSKKLLTSKGPSCGGAVMVVDPVLGVLVSMITSKVWVLNVPLKSKSVISETNVPRSESEDLPTNRKSTSPGAKTVPTGFPGLPPTF
jgi:hypothetical protein